MNQQYVRCVWGHKVVTYLECGNYSAGYFSGLFFSNDEYTSLRKYKRFSHISEQIKKLLSTFSKFITHYFQKKISVH